MRHGGRILIDQFARHGVPRVFLVPGESFLAGLDALHDEPRVQTIVCRHEQGAAMMAEATGKLTGKPGIAFVSRGPGAANALPGLLIAREDETAMILVVGLPPRTLDGRQAFQGIDAEKLFAGAAKATFTVRETARIPEYFASAYLTAMSGRPGPVVLAIPEDVLSAAADVPDAAIVETPCAAPSHTELTAIEDKLAGAEWPLMLVGGPGWSRDVEANIETFALRFDLPVVSAFRKQDTFDNRHRSYVGHTGIAIDPKLSAAIRAADVLLVVGAQLGEVTTSGYSLIQEPDPKQFLIRVHPSAEALAMGPRAHLSIVAGMRPFAEALSTIEPRPAPPWSAYRRDLRAAYEATLKPIATPGSLRLEAVVRHLSDTLASTAIIANGAGNYAQCVHRYFRYKQHGTCLAPGYGAMGYGLPAAVAAKLVQPASPVIAVAGDGCFLISSQELATAMQYALPIVIIVADNGMYGTIRMHQERAYPGWVSATTLVNPDFAEFARSFGAAGETVTSGKEFPAALERALAAGGPALIHLKLDPEPITPAETLSSILKDPEKD